MSVACIIPTVPGRSRYLTGAVASVTPACSRVLVLAGFDTCGAAWARGIRTLLWDPDWEHLLLFADDLEVQPGWDACVDRLPEQLPGAILLDYRGDRDVRTDDGPPGTLVSFPRVPLITREQAGRLDQYGFPPLHYYSDVIIGELLERPTVLDERFVVMHHWAQEGRRLDDSDDLALYARLPRP